jgi:uncharacterized membrane protein
MLVSPYSPVSRWLHWLFEASLLIKGLLAAGETISGLGLLLTPHGLILTFWTWLTQNDLAEDPTDAMAMWFRSLAEAFTLQSQHFYALYLLGHGVLKFTMVIMLTRRILWAYPAAMVILSGFVVYQSFEFVAHGSLVLLMLALFDAIMIVLVYREWNMLKFQSHDLAA